MSENKTLDEILEDFAKTFASLDDGNWWGHDTDLGPCHEAFEKAEEEIRQWHIRMNQPAK